MHRELWEKELASSPANIEYEDFAIGGKLISVYTTIPDDLFNTVTVNRDRARQIIVERMAETILQNNLCVTTTDTDHRTMSKVLIVRAYLAPNDQVRLLRKLKECQTPNYRK